MRGGEVNQNVATFLVKLWKIVDDPDTNQLISWNSNGQSFYIRNQAHFAQELLPLHFKHNNMASFIRQLNMYGFHKVNSAECGGLRPDKDEVEFSHPCFVRGRPNLLEHIKRKVSVAGTTAAAGAPAELKKVLTDVKVIQGKQSNFDSQLNEIKRENEVLWREVAVLRQKHLKQQQIVNKLIQFLVSMVHTSPRSGIGIKRHYPFMLSNIPHSSTKASKLNRMEEADSPGGPVIHELDPSDLLEDCQPQAETEQNTSMNEEFLEQEFNAEIPCPEVPSPAASASSMEELAAAVNTSSPEMLLELAEECHLNPRLYCSKKRGQKSPNAKAKQRKKAVSAVKPKVEPEETVSIEEFEPTDFLHEIPVEVNEDAQDGLQTPYVSDNLMIPLNEENRRILEGNGTEKGVDSTNKTLGVTNFVAGNGKNPIEAGPSTEGRTSRASDMAIVRSDTSELSRNALTEELDLHLDSMDSELDSLKELLKGEGYSLDANTLLGLFSEDPYSYELPMPMESEGDDKVGSELMTYNASSMDLADMLGSPADEWLLQDVHPNDGLITPDLSLETDPVSISSSKKK